MEQVKIISILGNSHGTLRTLSQVDSHVKFCSGFNDQIERKKKNLHSETKELQCNDK